MAEPLTTRMKRNINATATPDTFVTLVEVRWDALPEPFRFTDNNEDVTYLGNVYKPHPMQIMWPEDREMELARGTITLDNIDNALVVALLKRPRRQKLDLTLVRTLAEEPDANAQTRTLRVERIAMDETEITLSYSRRLPYDSPYPGFDFNPKDDPALFGV